MRRSLFTALLTIILEAATSGDDAKLVEHLDRLTDDERRTLVRACRAIVLEAGARPVPRGQNRPSDSDASTRD